MKMIKKISALFLASSLVFGACASAAEIGQFNKGRWDANFRSMATGTDWNGYHNDTDAVKVNTTYNEETNTLELRSRGVNATSGNLQTFGYNGIYGYAGTGDAIYGKVRSTIRWKFAGINVDNDPSTTKSTPQGEVFDMFVGHYAGNKNYLGYGGSYQNLNEGTTEHPGAKAINFNGKLSDAFKMPYYKELAMIVEVDTFTNTGTAKMVNVTDGVTLGSVEITPEDNKTFDYMVRGGAFRYAWFYDFDLIEMSADYDAYYVKDQSIDDSTDNIVATAKIGRNLVDGEGEVKNGALLVVAQYDANGRMLRLDKAAATNWPTSAPNRSGENLANCDLTVAKAEGYDNAKMFLISSGSDLSLFEAPISTLD